MYSKISKYKKRRKENPIVQAQNGIKNLYHIKYHFPEKQTQKHLY